MSVSFVFFAGGEKWVAHLQISPLEINLSIMVYFNISSDQINYINVTLIWAPLISVNLNRNPMLII